MDDLENETYEKSSLPLPSQYYEIKTIMYSALKAYEAGSGFGLSSGKKELSLDDTILEWEKGKIFCEVKYKAKPTTISEVQIFHSDGNYSLFKNLCVYYRRNFTPFLDQIEQRIEMIDGNPLNQNENGDKTIMLSLLSNVRNNNNFKESLDLLLKYLPTLNDRIIDKWVCYYENSSFRLVTNIFPNDKLCKTFQDFSAYTCPALALDKNWKFFRFYSNYSIEKLSKLVQSSKKAIPTDFIPIFLSKFMLISVPEKTLKTNIYELLEPLCSEYDIDNKYDFYNHLFDLFIEWRVEPPGTYITRRIMENNFFSRVVSEIFTEKLKRMKDVVQNNIDSVWMNITNHKLTVIQTDNYEHVMKKLQERFYNEDINKQLFLDPTLNGIVRQKVISAFRRNNCTHLVCRPRENDAKILDEIINTNFEEKVKKIVLIYEDEIRTRPEQKRMFDENLGFFENFIVTDLVYDSKVKQKTLIQIDKFFSMLDFRFLSNFLTEAKKLFVIEAYSHPSCFGSFGDDIFKEQSSLRDM